MIRNIWQHTRYKTFRTTTLSLFAIVLFMFLSSVLVILVEHNNSKFDNIGDGLWWVLITLSTTGYGDKIPETALGKTLAGLVIMGGITIMSVISATLASTFVRVDTEIRRGFMKADHMNNHIIICGWKQDDMAEIIKHIAMRNPSRERKPAANNIVIVANIRPSIFADLQKDPALMHMHFIHGEPYEEHTMKLANIEKAKKVIVLADSFERRSTMEMDARTVMTILAIRSITRSIYIIAELHDKKYEQYLKQASCDEIFFIEEFNKLMLASMSAISGFGSIIMNIMSLQYGVHIVTEPIPPQFVSRQYGEIKESLQHNGTRTMIGILEHVGNPVIMKLDALREAQKTANISQLVDNLQDAKNIQVNHPILLPGNDYNIVPNSMAIYLTAVGYAPS